MGIRRNLCGRSKSQKLIKRAAVLFLAIFVFWLGFLNYTEPTQIGVARNLATGKMWAQIGGGWHLTPPWVLVARIDTRPTRVSVDSAGHGFSAELVQFIPEQWEAFVNTEGFRYWWWANRISFNFGYENEHRGMKDILRGYAYSAKKYPFIKILTEYHDQ